MGSASAVLFQSVTDSMIAFDCLRKSMPLFFLTNFSSAFGSICGSSKKNLAFFGHFGDGDHAFLVHGEELFNDFAGGLFNRVIGNLVEAFDGVGKAVDGGFTDVFAVHPGEFLRSKRALVFWMPLREKRSIIPPHLSWRGFPRSWPGAQPTRAMKLSRASGRYPERRKSCTSISGSGGFGDGGEFDGDFDGVGLPGHAKSWTSLRGTPDFGRGQ